MLNMKKILIAGTVMTALCATAFAATNDQADKPTMRERVNRILCENRGDCPAGPECQGIKDGKHFQGEGFRGHGPHGPRPDCSPAICPPAPAK